jgi:predicted PurR-regulated permease PerM
MPIDKQYHFIAGMLIYLIAQLFMPVAWALLPVVIIATLKEVYDYLSKKGTPDVNDLLFTMYGALPIFTLKLILANTNT